MPGARPTPPAVGGSSRRRTLPASRAGGALASRPGANPLRPLVRRAAGLVLGIAVLIPVATAVGGSHGAHPDGPPSVAAGVAGR
ncbi:conserved hypothetical protein [Frankia sp. AiPs1]|nr:hypothetical protein [Frankia sp. AiPa1]